MRHIPRAILHLALVAAVLIAGGAAPADRPRTDDNQTFRPTVLVRCGRGQGSGTVIASVDDETLVLTAAHVVKEPGPLRVEVHRYNLGLERTEPSAGWPLSVKAEVAATDAAADIAVLRIRGKVALPYVARLAADGEELERGAIVTSIGIDLGAHLSSWNARVVEVALFELDGRAERPFVITTRPPEHGRSGGGLFRENGDLVGVCIGRVEPAKGRRTGVFASCASIHRLLRDHNLVMSVVRSEVRHRAVTRRAHAPITTTRSQSAR